MKEGLFVAIWVGGLVPLVAVLWVLILWGFKEVLIYYGVDAETIRVILITISIIPLLLVGWGFIIEIYLRGRRSKNV